MAWLGAFGSAAAADLNELVLGIGETRTIEVSRSSDANLVVGDPAVLGVTALGDTGQVVLTGLKPGVSSLVIFERRSRTSYIVRVYGVPPDMVSTQVRPLVEDLPRIAVRRVGDRVVLDGEVNTAADCERIKRIVGLYPGSIESLVTCDDAGATERPLFALELQVVDITSSDGLDVGIDWPTELGATASGSLSFDDTADPSTVMTGVVDTTQLAVGLRLLTTEGQAEIRTRSTLVTEADSPAKYKVGGEFFVRTGGLSGGALETVSYGTALEIRPSMDEKRHVRLVIDAAISQPDGSQAIEGVPGLITNEVQTRVNLREGQTIILSGLDDQTRETREEGLWPFAQIPILGYLFKTHRANERHRRTLIFVTPRLYRPGDPFHQKTIEPMLQRGPDSGDDF